MDHSLTKFDLIWNRAALEHGGDDPLDGDRNLAALLLMHGMINNGGVFHGLETLTMDEINEAIAAYSFFEFENVSEFLLSMIGTSENEEAEIQANKRYSELVPDDDVIFHRVESFFKVSPNLFAALEG